MTDEEQCEFENANLRRLTKTYFCLSQIIHDTAFHGISEDLRKRVKMQILLFNIKSKGFPRLRQQGTKLMRRFNGSHGNAKTDAEEQH